MCGIYKKITGKIKAGDPTWKDDFTENLNCLNPTQISAIEILSSAPATAELVDIIPTDCEGVATGEETKASATVVLNNVLSTLCNVDDLADAIGDRMAEETQKIVDAIPDETLVDFQPVDCAGDNVGAVQKAYRTTVLNNVLASLCNTSDIVDPIIEAIQEQSTSLKKQDFISWVAAVGDTLTIPLSKFSTISMLATKGEFTVTNTANDFIPDLTASAGTLSDFVEISEDGVGTSTGSTLAPQGYDTRANSLDMALSLIHI